jgi:hypothetical protein
MSLVLAVLFFYGSHLLETSRQDVFELRDQLGLETAPEIGVLTNGARIVER